MIKVIEFSQHIRLNKGLQVNNLCVAVYKSLLTVLKQAQSQLGNAVLSPVEQGRVAVHQSCVSDELVSVLVLVALALVLDVLQRNGVLDNVLVSRRILFGHLVVEDPMPVYVPHLLQNLHKDLVQGLVGGLLSLALRLVVHPWLHLVVEVLFAKAKRFESRLGVNGLLPGKAPPGYPLALSLRLCKLSSPASSSLRLEVIIL